LDNDSASLLANVALFNRMGEIGIAPCTEAQQRIQHTCPIRWIGSELSRQPLSKRVECQLGCRVRSGGGTKLSANEAINLVLNTFVSQLISELRIIQVLLFALAD